MHLFLFRPQFFFIIFLSRLQSVNYSCFQNLSIYLSIYLSSSRYLYLSIYLSIYLSVLPYISISLFISPFLSLSLSLYIYIYINICLCLSLSLSPHTFTFIQTQIHINMYNASINLCSYLSIYLSIYLSMFTYLGSSVSSTEIDINTRLAKAWVAINRLTVLWKSDLTDKIKHSFFQAAVESILLYGCTTWTLTKRMEKKLDGNYTRML